jgi:hypothetical protein
MALLHLWTVLYIASGRNLSCFSKEVKFLCEVDFHSESYFILAYNYVFSFPYDLPKFLFNKYVFFFHTIFQSSYLINMRGFVADVMYAWKVLGLIYSYNKSQRVALFLIFILLV